MASKEVENSRRRFALLMALTAAVLALALALYNTQRIDLIPLWDAQQPSIISILTHTTILVSLVVSAVSLRRFNPDYDQIKPTDHLAVIFRWVSRAGFILAVIFILTLLVILILSLVSHSIVDSAVPGQPIVIIAMIYGAGLGFVLAYWTSKLTYQQVLWFTAISMVLGLAGAIILSPDNVWWTGVLSLLGLGSSAWIFDGTFIVGGLLLLIVIEDKLDDLEILYAAGKFQSSYFKSYHVLLVASCIAMIGIGLFPYTGFTLWPHRIFAVFAIFSFLLIAPAFIWLLPIYSHSVRLISVIPASMSFLAVIAYFFWGLEFALMELILILLIMVWIITFYYATRAYILKTNPLLEND